MKIYVASSWRNIIQPAIVVMLRRCGHDVYDFRSPAPGNDGFSWSEIDPNWQQWSPTEYRKALEHPIAERGFNYDMNALRECDACVLVLPSGRSASFEFGWAIGAGKRGAVVMFEACEPELMYRGNPILTNTDELFDWAGGTLEEQQKKQAASDTPDFHQAKAAIEGSVLMTTQHTPGPWEVGSSGFDGHPKYANIYAQDESYHVAVVLTEELSLEASQANAELIAAAPDLLAACEAALSWLTNYNLSYPATVGRQLMAAMERAGYDKQTLDDAAVALVRGPCSVPTLYGEETI